MAADWTLGRAISLMGQALDRAAPEADRLDLIRELLELLNPIIGED